MLILISTIISLVCNGLFKAIFPDIYENIINIENREGVARSTLQIFTDTKMQQELFGELKGLKATILYIIGLLPGLGIAIWIITVWGAYRDLNNASRGRSFVAFIVSYVLFLLISVMFMGMFPPAPSGTSYG